MKEVTNTQVGNMFAIILCSPEKQLFLEDIAFKIHGLHASTKVAYAPFKTVKLINYDHAIHNI